MSVSTPERTSLLGGESRPRRLFGQLSVSQLIALSVAGIVGMVLLVTTQSLIVLGIEVLIALGVRWVWRRRTRDEDSMLDVLGDSTRLKIAEYTGADRYDPPAIQPRPVPLELGSVSFASAQAHDNAPEMAVVDHASDHGDYLSTVVEVLGGGEGLRDVRETNAAGAAFGALLYGLAAPGMPVEQIDLTTRVLPVPASAYRQWARDHVDEDAAPVVTENLTDLAGRVSACGERYRSWMTLRMPRAGLAARASRTGRVTPERILDAAYEVTAEVARRAGESGLTVRGGQGPVRLGALVRHLYNPSYQIGDVTGISSVRDGFQPYRSTRRALHVPAEKGPDWWHATASVPRDGWPLRPVGMRWLEALVTDITPATIRTVTAQFRLTSAQTARERAAVAHTLDQAEIKGDQAAGRVSTGLNEAQASASARVLDDVVNKAAGCLPALRITVSAPGETELSEARDRVHNAAMDEGQINRLRWHDTRHHQAHLLTLPFARGIRS